MPSADPSVKTLDLTLHDPARYSTSLMGPGHGMGSRKYEPSLARQLLPFVFGSLVCEWQTASLS